MLRLPPRSTLTDTLFPYTTLFRSSRSAPRQRTFIFCATAPSRRSGKRDAHVSAVHVRLIRTMEQLVRHFVAAETGFADVRHRRRRLNAVTHRHRSEERSEGKECVSTCRSRWSAYH